MITKYVKFDYFRVVFRPVNAPENAPDVNYDLRPLIHKISLLELPDRAIPYKQEKARLDLHSFNPGTSYWDLYFSRLRDFNLPTRAREDAPSEPFDLDDDEYIGENVSALYDEDHHILMIQRNKFGLGPSAIVDYFNHFNDDQSIEICLRPISIPDPRSKVRSAKYLRKLRIRFADLDKRQTIERGVSLNKWLSIFDEHESISGEIILSVGRQRKLTLSNLDTFMDELVNNKDIISGAEISIKRDDITETELVDLFENHAYDVVSFTVPPRTVLNHEAVVYQMMVAYTKRRPEIVRYLVQ
jgi:hypothetical protein